MTAVTTYAQRRWSLAGRVSAGGARRTTSACRDLLGLRRGLGGRGREGAQEQVAAQATWPVEALGGRNGRRRWVAVRAVQRRTGRTGRTGAGAGRGRVSVRRATQRSGGGTHRATGSGCETLVSKVGACRSLEVTLSSHRRQGSVSEVSRRRLGGV